MWTLRAIFIGEVRARIHKMADEGLFRFILPVIFWFPVWVTYTRAEEFAFVQHPTAWPALVRLSSRPSGDFLHSLSPFFF